MTQRDNLANFNEKANFLWSVADLIRDSFKRGKYQDVILPFTVLKRIDSVLVPSKEEVLREYNKYKDKMDNLDPILRRTSGYAFYNTSRYTFETLLDDPQNIGENLRLYINSFSPNMREVLDKFRFEQTISALEEADLLYQVVEKFNTIDLHPDRVSNLEMGYIFEELIRRFNEMLDENPGEHFTPREVIELMVNLLLAQDKDMLAENHIVRTIYDPACGSGGMLTIAEEWIEELNPNADVRVFGQEVNPETWAVSVADLFLKDPSGEAAENIAFGSTLSQPAHIEREFDYMLANPPYGKDWKRDRKAVDDEHERGHAGRFGAGTPRVSDGQLLFLQHMLYHMRPAEDGGSRVAIVMNGSPLFTGDAGSGESEIRRWMMENDWVEAIVELPEQIFYNTGISTYIWLLSNRKPAERKGKVQLIDASELWEPMQKSLGDKRRYISDGQIDEITAIHQAFEKTDRSKIFPTTEFGFRKVRVERPLRLNYQASPERIERLEEERAFQRLVKNRKKKLKEHGEIPADDPGRQEQEAILAVLEAMPKTLFRNREEFLEHLDSALEEAGLDLKASLVGAIEAALSERDDEAEIMRDSKGRPESDTDLRDYENVPLGQDVFDFFSEEVEPYVSDAWIDESYTDEKDGEVGRVGYEINFNRYFYEYTPPRRIPEIQVDLGELETEIVNMLSEITHSLEIDASSDGR